MGSPYLRSVITECMSLCIACPFSRNRGTWGFLLNFNKFSTWSYISFVSPLLFGMLSHCLCDEVSAKSKMTVHRQTVDRCNVIHLLAVQSERKVPSLATLAAIFRLDIMGKAVKCSSVKIYALWNLEILCPEIFMRAIR